MMADFNHAMKYLETMEGGYWAGGVFNGKRSGETYRGIDRLQQKGKPAALWAAIDQYKKTIGTPKRGEYFKGTLGELINNEVDKFTLAWWNNTGMHHFKNSTLAALCHAFIYHSYRFPIINAVAKKFGATKTSTSKITPEVAAALEKNLPAGYEATRTALIKYYNAIDPKGTFIENRIKPFPTKLTTAAAATALTVAAGSSVGLFSWIAALLGLSKL